uniref:Uncharacterized protein n=1 Tax=Anguilla anguilla TaxID=7936 RepID=A0A0E9V290_ANGAN
MTHHVTSRELLLYFYINTEKGVVIHKTYMVSALSLL